MQLCQNRPEGLSISSKISKPLPTQCFFDTILVPLPTWILLVLLVIFALGFRFSLTGMRSHVSKRWLRITAVSVYYFCIAVIILMESVEIARLARADLGIALTPFVYAGCVVAIVLQATDGFRGVLRGWQLANVLFWVASTCITVMKLVAVQKFGTTGTLARNDTEYPIEHQVTDLVILVIFYPLLVVLEVVVLFVRNSHSTVSSYGSESFFEK